MYIYKSTHIINSMIIYNELCILLLHGKVKTANLEHNGRYTRSIDS